MSSDRSEADVLYLGTCNTARGFYVWESIMLLLVTWSDAPYSASNVPGSAKLDQSDNKAIIGARLRVCILKSKLGDLVLLP